MTKNIVKKGTGIVPAAAIGAGISIVITLVGAAITAILIGNESIEIERVSVASGIIRILAAAIGALIATGIAGKSRLGTSFVSAGMYLAVLLLITVFVFGGEFSGFFSTVATVATGALIVVLTGLKEKGKSGFKKKMKAYR